MAEALQIIDCSSGIVPALRSFLQSRLREVIRFRKLVLRSATVENIHDMRVAVRRLRSALGDFALKVDPAAVDSLKKRLRKVAAELGNVRDKDVAIAELKQLKHQADGKISAGIRKLIKKQRKSRKQIAKQLGNVLPGSAKIKHAVAEASSHIEQNTPETMTFGELGKLAVENNLSEFRRLSRDVNVDTDGETLHDLRISAKKLRYSIELFTPCVNIQFAEVASLASELQSTLGEAHDADVWINSLTEFPGAEVSPETTNWLISRFQEKREKYNSEAMMTTNSLLQLTSDQSAEHFSESSR